MSETKKLLPGTGSLGRAVNILGSPGSNDDAVSGFQIFDLKKGGETYSFGGNDYFVPDNVDPPQPESQGDAYVKTYASRQEYTEDLAVALKVDAKYRAFEGSFEGKFGISRRNETEFEYAVMRQHYDGFRLTLASNSEAGLKEQVRAELDALPATFNSETQVSFFGFLAKYGTHYVNSVRCSGAVSMYSRVDKSDGFKSAEIEANLKASFDGLFSSASAEVDARWKRVDKNWLRAQETSIRVVGGKPSLLGVAALPNAPGESKNKAYEAWLESIQAEPVVTSFTLAPLWMIPDSSSGKQTALRDAIEAWACNTVQVNVSSGKTGFTGSPVRLPGLSATPPRGEEPYLATAHVSKAGTYEYPVGGAFLQVLDRMSLEVLMQFNDPGKIVGKTAQDYDLVEYSKFTSSVAELRKNTEVLVVATLWGWDSVLFPEMKDGGQALYSALRELGGGQALDKLAALSASGTSTAEDGPAVYMIVGVPGTPKLAKERLVISAGEPYEYPTAALDIVLFPGQRDGLTMYSPV